MKKALKIIGFILLILIVGVAIYASVKYIKRSSEVEANYDLLGKEASVLSVNGQQYRDLNKNGKRDVYEDINAPVNERVDDLIKQMNLEEKAGLMFISMINMTDKGDPVDYPIISTNKMDMILSFMLPPASEMLAKKQLRSFNTISSYSAEVMAKFNNNIQKIAERGRLGIPVTIATDPRHGTENNPGASIFTPAFSQWPSSLGLAATRDTVLVREFGNIARQEYRAVGLTLTLSPMADLATEPRWGRINGTFGEDAELSSAMTKAYILGFQGDSLTNTSVACMAKHFSGGGPQKDGEDPHFPYGKEQVYPGNNFNYHIIPFVKGALAAHTASIMPYYGIPMDQTDENVAFGFNKQIITDLLRDSLQFNGVVCTDWNIISKSKMGDPRSWGVENLSQSDKVKKVLDAGCDQFGGELIPEVIVDLVKSGQITENRIDQSVKRILKEKFTLGLFDNPYVDVAVADQIAGQQAFIERGKIAQQKSVVLLKNDNLLPLKKGVKLYAEGITNKKAFKGYAELVDDPKDADVILDRINTPFDKRDQFFLEQFFHQGRLYYNEEEKSAIFKLTGQKPTIMVVNLERPAILTEINEKSTALLAEFGVTDEVLLKILFGEVNPTGKLPFELPSSQEAVEKQLEDVPYDSKDPLYPFGFGLTFK